MSDRHLLQKMLADLSPERWLLLIGIILYLPLTFFSIVQPLVIGYAVSHAMGENASTSVASFSALFLLVVALLAIVELSQGLCLQLVGQKFVERLRQKAFDKVQRLPLGFLDTTPLGKILTRLTNDAESVAELFSLGAIQIVGDLLFLFGTFLMLFFVDLKLSFYSLLILPVLVIGIHFFRIWTKSAFIRIRAVLSNLNGFLQEYLSGMSTIQIAGRMASTKKDFDEFNQHYLSVNRQAIFLEASAYSFVDALSYCASAIVLWGAFTIQQEEALSLGIVVAFLEALSRFFQPIRELSNRYTIFQSALVSLDRIYQLLDWPEEDHTKAGSGASFNHAINFNHVSFSYQNGDKVLKDISFTLKKGEHIALVGHTGAGKSTVIKLLHRFYEPSAGEILVDAKNIHELSLGQLRTLISVVPQEVFLFQGNVLENLTFGNDKASDEQIWHALKVVQMEEAIRLRGGLLAPVEAKGQNFSLGERQLLAFARALIANPPVIVLDEATASVDKMTEQRLQYATKELLKNRTALIIAHRLSTIAEADRILVFEQGEIVEEGNHQHLLEKAGIYARYIYLQRQVFS